MTRIICPRHDVGASVRVKPLEDMAGRVVELVRTAEEGWVYVVRYIVNGEAKTMRCFPDEIEGSESVSRETIEETARRYLRSP